MKFPHLSIGMRLLSLLATGLPAQGIKNATPASPAPATVSFADNGQKLGTGDSWYVQLVDINGNERLEAYFDGAIWLNDGKGHFIDSGLRLGHANSAVAAMGDLNGAHFRLAASGRQSAANLHYTPNRARNRLARRRLIVNGCGTCWR